MSNGLAIFAYHVALSLPMLLFPGCGYNDLYLNVALITYIPDFFHRFFCPIGDSFSYNDSKKIANDTLVDTFSAFHVLRRRGSDRFRRYGCRWLPRASALYGG